MLASNVGMSDKNDVLAPSASDDFSEVSLSAALEGTSLTVAGKSRALSGADQLLGGLFGIPGAALENIREDIRLNGRIRRAIKVATAEKALAAIENDDVLGQLAAQAHLADQRRKFVNKAAVWIEAEEQLKALPLPEAATSPEQPTGSEMDEDWMNVFGEYAGRASSERLRELWGRILAGEIRRPGEFSLTTLRVVSELDQQVASTFERLVRLRTSHWLLNPGAAKGREFLDWRLMEEAGLVESPSGLGSQYTLTRTEDGRGYLRIGQHMVIGYFPAGRRNATLKVRMMTRAGQEIAQLLPHDTEATARAIAEAMKGDLRQIDVAVITREVGTDMEWTVIDRVP